jgi:hypothetical protein
MYGLFGMRDVPGSRRDGLRKDDMIPVCYVNPFDIMKNFFDNFIKNFSVLKNPSCL